MMNNIDQIRLVEPNKIPLSILGYVRIIGLEGIIWITALIYLALFVNPFETHFTICPLANAGFEHCPGCGLGNSISLFFHGYFKESFNTHVLGIPALFIILHRIYSIIRFNFKKVKTTIQ
jgi:Protein of unknown function (DUF2752)